MLTCLTSLNLCMLKDIILIKTKKLCISSIQHGGIRAFFSLEYYEGIRTFLTPGIFLYLSVLGDFELYQVFMCQAILIFLNIYIITKRIETL